MSVVKAQIPSFDIIDFKSLFLSLFRDNRGLRFSVRQLWLSHFLNLGDKRVEIYRVAFIGHRYIDNIIKVENKIEKIVRELFCEHDYVELYVGRNGDFDISAASSVKRAQKIYGTTNSSLILVLPYSIKDESFFAEFYDEIYYPLNPKIHYKSAITKRNKWMVDNAQLLIDYVEEGRNGGALTTLKYEQKKGTRIINLAEKEDI